jgi:hypothetical protein
MIRNAICTLVPKHASVKRIVQSIELGRYWGERYDYLLSLLRDMGAEPGVPEYNAMMHTWQMLSYAPGALSVWHQIARREDIQVNPSLLVLIVITFYRWIVMFRTGPHEVQRDVHGGITVGKLINASMEVTEYANLHGLQSCYSSLAGLSLRILKETGTFDELRRGLQSVHGINVDLLDAPPPVENVEHFPVKHHTLNMLMSLFSDRHDLSKMISVYERFAHPLPVLPPSATDIHRPPPSPFVDESEPPQSVQQKEKEEEEKPMPPSLHESLGVDSSIKFPPRAVNTRTLDYLIKTAVTLQNFTVALHYLDESVRVAAEARRLFIHQHARHVEWERAGRPSELSLDPEKNQGPWLPELRVYLSGSNFSHAFSRARARRKLPAAVPIYELAVRAREELARDYEAILAAETSGGRGRKGKAASSDSTTPSSSSSSSPSPSSSSSTSSTSSTPHLILPHRPELPPLSRNVRRPERVALAVALLERALDEFDVLIPQMETNLARLIEYHQVRFWRAFVASEERSGSSSGLEGEVREVRAKLRAYEEAKANAKDPSSSAAAVVSNSRDDRRPPRPPPSDSSSSEGTILRPRNYSLSQWYSEVMREAEVRRKRQQDAREKQHTQRMEQPQKVEDSSSSRQEEQQQGPFLRVA